MIKLNNVANERQTVKHEELPQTKQQQKISNQNKRKAVLIMIKYTRSLHHNNEKILQSKYKNNNKKKIMPTIIKQKDYAIKIQK